MGNLSVVYVAQGLLSMVEWGGPPAWDGALPSGWPQTRKPEESIRGIAALPSSQGVGVEGRWRGMG